MKKDKNDKIIEVTLYSDRALVTRSIKIGVKPGKGKAVFENLPEGIDKDAIRVSGNGSAILKIESIDVNDEYIKGYSDKEIEAMSLKIEELKDKLVSIDTKIRIKNEEKALFISGLSISSSNFWNAFYHKKTSVQDVEESISSFFCDYQKTIEALFALNQERRSLLLENEKAKSDFDKCRTTPYNHVLNCSVSYNATKEGEFTFYLTYIIFGVSWRPSYDVRLLEKEKKLEFSYYALVNQQSGEAWDEVDMFISTAKPSMRAYLPELTPWFIGSQISLPVNVPSGGVNMSGFAIGDFEEAPADVKSNSFDATFSLANKVSLLSDKKEKRVLIMKTLMDAELSYRTYPKTYNAAYINAQIENTTPYPILSGDIKVFHLSDYVGESKIDALLPGEKAFLCLGIESSIKVERELVRKYTSAKGVVKDYTKKIFEYKIKLANYKDGDVNIKIEEPVPLSMNKEIKVKCENATDDIAPDDKGLLVWDAALLKGGKKEIRYTLNVEYPQNRALTDALEG
jgi:hypothetical protein